MGTQDPCPAGPRNHRTLISVHKWPIFVILTKTTLGRHAVLIDATRWQYSTNVSNLWKWKWNSATCLFLQNRENKGVWAQGRSHPASQRETISIPSLTRQIRQPSSMDGYSKGFINSSFLGTAGPYSRRDEQEARKLWSQYGSLKGYRGCPASLGTLFPSTWRDRQMTPLAGGDIPAPCPSP